MADSLNFISTKLKMPLPRKHYIVREKLFEKLEGILEHKVTLVKGSAGSGKTTLLTSFIKEKAINPVKWITLDKDNNNVFSFWHYFLEAIKEFLGESKEDILSLFKSVLQKEDIENLVTVLINQLDSEKDFIIVLDDFQYINDSFLIETLELFIKYSSDNTHLVLLTREEPSFYLGDLIMSGRLLQITEDDLKLSPDEGMNFLKHTLMLDLPQEIMNDINSLAEGWIGGLQLIAITPSSSRNQLIKDNKVLNKYMVEYLSKEIFESLGEIEKEFLVKTSLLGYFDEHICNLLLNWSNSGDIIASLLDNNLFMINIGGESGVYRYHNILGEFLKLQFQKLDKTVKIKLQSKASEIYKELGDLDESIKYLFSIEDYEGALKLISLMEQNINCWTYLGQIPLSYIAGNKDMAFQRLFYHYSNMELKQCNEIFELLKDKIENDKDWNVFKFAKALIEDMNFEVDTMSLQNIDTTDLSDSTKAIIYLKAATFLYYQDKFKEALDFLEKTASIENIIKNPYIKYFITTVKSQIKEELGDLLECEKLYDEALHQLDRYKFLHPLTINCYIGAAGVYLKNLNLEKAEQVLQQAADIIDPNIINYDAGYLYNLMELKILTEKWDEAYEIFKKLMNHDFYKNIIYSSALIKYLTYMNKVDYELIDKYSAAYLDYDKKYIRMEDKLTYARVLQIKGKSATALELIDEILQVTRKEKVKVKLIEALLLKIDILSTDSSMGKREILNLLREAIHYSYENRILSPYIYMWDKIEKYVIMLKAERSEDLNPKEKGFLSEIVKLITKDKEQHNQILSDRELEVLIELATGAANKEIGERLCISLSTVKTHIINIYSKLQVSNRIEAIEKAKERNIL